MEERQMTKEQIIADMIATKAKLADVAAQIAHYGSRNCVAVVRLHDRRHDLEARDMMLCRMFDAVTA
jgi:hypothetical protein